MWVWKKIARPTRGQSFVELAVVLPILLLLLAGLVEVAFLFFNYMTAVDQTREAARFASVRDFYTLDLADLGNLPQGACTDDSLHFYYDTACFFTDHNLNPSLEISPTQYADVTISVFTIANNTVTNRWPRNDFPAGANPPLDPDGDNVWSLYSTAGIPNWKYDCEGNVVLNEPFFTNAEIESMLVPNAPPNRGLVLIEVWYCHRQLMNFPVFSQLVSRPLRMHAYTIMPLPNAIPTPTAIPQP